MKKQLLAGLFGLSFVCSSQFAHASIESVEWTYNIDGAVSDSVLGDSIPLGISGSLDSSGLGTLSYTFTGTGTHNFLAFYDMQIDAETTTYYNEYGANNGSLASGQSWEIGDPWYGDIYNNVTTGLGALDNSNGNTGAGDVSFAQGWNFNLNAGETATITLNLADVLPSTVPGFYLSQYQDSTSSDPNPPTIYYWSTLDISGPTNSVPEPAPLALMGIGLIALGVTRKKNTSRKI